VAAHLAPCPALQEVFRSGRDPHRTTAATITGKAESEITTRERKLAKAVNFGFLFGMGPARFRSYAADSYGVELSNAEAQSAKRSFFATYPGIATWHERIGRLGRSDVEDVTVRTHLGRRKRFPAGQFSFNAALNIPVQGTAAEGFKLAMTELHRRLPEIGGRGVLCIHDEYLAEIPTENADRGRDLVADVMRTAMASLVTSTPIEVEARIVDSWGNASG
jgi:DNA polymerase I-like protein with 3'-5' exonuclease and polymerase domains